MAILAILVIFLIVFACSFAFIFFRVKKSIDQNSRSIEERIKASEEEWTRLWDRLPSLPEYWAANPETKTNKGTQCKNCRSGHIRRIAIKHGWVHYCNQCSAHLYRSPETT